MRDNCQSYSRYHVKIVTAFLKASVPFSKIDSFRDLVEENAYCFTNRRNILNYVPFILKQEESLDITGKDLSVIFDGMSPWGSLGKHCCTLIVGNDCFLQQHLVRVHILSNGRK